MKTRILYTLLLTGTLSGLTAQNLQFLDQANANISSTTITIAGDVNDWSIEEYIKVRNVGNNNIDVKIKRYEMSVVSGTKNYFCWTLCYSPMNAGANWQFPTPTDNAWNDFVTVNAGTTSAYQLIAYHQPYSNAGSSTYRYVAFDGNNTNDSVYIDVAFDVTLGVNEMEKTSSFTLYPNPANADVNLNFEAANSTAVRSIVVYDVLGNKISEQSLIGTSGTYTFNISALNNGVYFYALHENGKAILTKKLIVSH